MDLERTRRVLKELINPPKVISEKVFPPFQINPEHMSFIRNRILGPQGSHLKHIKSATKTSVTLRGRGSGFVQVLKTDESLHLRIESTLSSHANSISEAKQLCEDLFNTVKSDYLAKIHGDFLAWQQYYHRLQKNN